MKKGECIVKKLHEDDIYSIVINSLYSMEKNVHLPPASRAILLGDPSKDLRLVAIYGDDWEELRGYDLEEIDKQCDCNCDQGFLKNNPQYKITPSKIRLHRLSFRNRNREKAPRYARINSHKRKYQRYIEKMTIAVKKGEYIVKKLNENDIYSIVIEYLTENEVHLPKLRAVFLGEPSKDLRLVVVYSDDEDKLKDCSLEEIDKQCDYNGEHSFLKNNPEYHVS